MGSKSTSPLRDLGNVLRGFLMGGADIIPGVSGGTVALILGIYDRLVTAISHADLQFLTHVRRRAWGAAAQHIDLRFLMTLACGIGLGVGGLASLMHYLLGNQQILAIQTVQPDGRVRLTVDRKHHIGAGESLLVLRRSDAAAYEQVAELTVIYVQTTEGVDGAALAEPTGEVTEPPQIQPTDIVIPAQTLASFKNARTRRMLTFATFFGLILASTVLVARLIPRWTAPRFVAAILGAVFAYWLVGQPFLASPPDALGYIFFCGMIAICAMILPGISGAFILLILGKYEYVAGMLRSALHGDVTLTTLLTLATFICGCAIGLLGFSKLLRWLLSHYHEATLAVLCGFMAGSLRKIWPFKLDLTPETAELRSKQFENIWPATMDGTILAAIGLAIAAIVFVFLLDRLSRTHEQTHADETASVA